jgi:Flp pilus assembly protein TadD
MRLVEGADAALGRGTVTDAAEMLERAIVVDPTCPRAWVSLARLHLVQGHYAQSLGFLEKAEELAVGDPGLLGETASMRGLALEALGRPEAARNAYERALALVPGDAQARAGLVRLEGVEPAGEPW